jgi:hypothetical protein
VNIHSKVIVLDPFGESPVVMTGSHNLGFKASNANDDNLVIIEGNGPLAAAYAINIIAIFQSYRWNSYVEAHRQDPKVWHGLVDNDQWQASYMTGNDLAELKFWMGAKTAETTAKAAPVGGNALPPQGAPAAHAIHSVSVKTPGRPSAKKTAPVAKKATPKEPPAKKAAAAPKKTAHKKTVAKKPKK